MGDNEGGDGHDGNQGQESSWACKAEGRGAIDGDETQSKML